ncbi:scarecrow-like protein 18 [Eucalyptus grandis]|uniref:scarecrow-like protein 18 n=1 Tax=Eucalyptus grandis TaxID=71139 RepID=UPI00192EBD46|nr:scarecrow-like protein 18 [Eucalyptus grandis]
MLGSFSSNNSHEEEEQEHHHHHHQHHHHSDSPSDLQHHQFHYHHLIPHHHAPPALPSPPPFPTPPSTLSSSASPSVINTRQLLVTCAELLSLSNFAPAHRLISILSANSSPYGDSTERLVHQFSRALSIRLHRSAVAAAAPPNRSSLLFPHRSNSSTVFGFGVDSAVRPGQGSDPSALQSCYLTLNQVTPFIRFSHLTANQAILEAIDGQRAVHIVDLDIMHGVQWPPLMQAIVERSSTNDKNALLLPPTLRITGAGHDLEALHRTGDRLSTFAQSLGLEFQFCPLLLPHDALSVALHAAIPSEISTLPDEALAVNCVLCLHRLLKDDARELSIFLRKIKALRPRVVTVAEREASHNHPMFLQRFVEALDHYTAVFDSLEATLPPSSRERLALEQAWFGREIADIIGEEGEGRLERHERFESWEVLLRSSGFVNVPLSPFALSQAKLLLRLHYPSEGYQLQVKNSSVFLGWQSRALFTVSSWR